MTVFYGKQIPKLGVEREHKNSNLWRGVARYTQTHCNLLCPEVFLQNYYPVRQKIVHESRERSEAE